MLHIGRSFCGSPIIASIRDDRSTILDRHDSSNVKKWREKGTSVELDERVVGNVASWRELLAMVMQLRLHSSARDMGMRIHLQPWTCGREVTLHLEQVLVRGRGPILVVSTVQKLKSLSLKDLLMIDQSLHSGIRIPSTGYPGNRLLVPEDRIVTRNKFLSIKAFFAWPCISLSFVPLTHIVAVGIVTRFTTESFVFVSSTNVNGVIA